MTSEGSRCDETSADSECYVQLPRRVVQQMTETCRLLLMTAAHLVQPASTNNHATQTTAITAVDQQQQSAVDNTRSEDTDSLKKVIRELVDKNISWQSLCNEKDTEILLLRQRLTQAESLLSQQPDSQRPADTVSQHQSTSPGDATDRTWMLEARQRQLEQTISSLTDSLANKQSTIDTLQLQVVIYREDFQSERQDRERAQSQIAELQAQLNQLEQSRQRAATSTAPQVERSHEDTFARCLPQQCQHHRCHGNVPAAVGWYPWHVGGVDVTDAGPEHNRTTSWNVVAAKHSRSSST